MVQPIFQIDSFTDHAFGGNPAAVCILEELRDDAWMQNVARRFTLYALQASPRGGVVHVRVAEDRVIIAGQAVTVMRASLLV